MKHGFIKFGAITPALRVADTDFNADSAIEAILKASEDGVKVLALPELFVTAYTCGDLFRSEVLLDGAEAAVMKIAAATADTDTLVFIGAPVRALGKLYNCAVAVKSGKILGATAKVNIPNYAEFYELRHFSPAPEHCVTVSFAGREIPMGEKLIYECENVKDLVVGAEVCEDLWVPCPPSTYHTAAGATVIVNLSASDETVGKDDYRRTLVLSKSAAMVCAYVYADAGEGESTTDLVFSGHDIIGDNGVIAAQALPFSGGAAVCEVDVQKYAAERRVMNTYPKVDREGYTVVKFSLESTETKLTREVDPHPFVPSDPSKRAERCRSILDIQSHGLSGRMKAIHANSAVIAVSGGLDSCLALLVCVRAFDYMKLERRNITAVSMPCFGTTTRTKNNAETLCSLLGVSFRCIDIKEAVDVHFRDIGHDPENRNVVYENAQARERYQIGFDIANESNALFVGTGDLSELALGWTTYNGDHMSGYGVNASVPKTLVRHIVGYCADVSETEGNAALTAVLRDILATPVSPELLPPSGDEIAQRTEELVGPYELHDFFIYYTLRYGYTPEKILRLAVAAFCGREGCEYTPESIAAWQKVFIRRFFSQQFKRSCLPDGPKVGSAALSPRGDLRMPSDASSVLWLEKTT